MKLDLSPDAGSPLFSFFHPIAFRLMEFLSANGKNATLPDVAKTWMIRPDWSDVEPRL
jgi:hypothetical protein